MGQTACASVRRGKEIKDKSGKTIGHDCICTRYDSTVLHPELRDKDNFTKMCLAVGATHKKVGGNVSQLTLREDKQKTMEGDMNIASFEGYSPLDVFESDMVMDELKDLGIALGAGGVLAIAAWEALNQIGYGSIAESANTGDKMLGYLRPLIPVVLGGAVGYFLKEKSAPAGYALMGAGASLGAGMYWQAIRKQFQLNAKSDNKEEVARSYIPFQFNPHPGKEEMSGMMPMLVPDFRGMQVNKVPEFSGYADEYSDSNSISL
jgi:hypothetical protein